MPRRFRRRALSLTPLVDVIFLLLLFFMLTSTFVRHGEIELSAASGGVGGEVAAARFLRLGEGTLTLAGRAVAPGDLTELLAGERVLLSLADGVTAQRLIDVLAVLRGVPGLTLTVLR